MLYFSLVSLILVLIAFPGSAHVTTRLFWTWTYVRDTYVQKVAWFAPNFPGK